MVENPKKAGAKCILGAVSLGLIWDVYNTLDNRIRLVEIESRMTTEIVKDIKEDTKLIKSMLLEVKKD